MVVWIGLLSGFDLRRPSEHESCRERAFDKSALTGTLGVLNSKSTARVLPKKPTSVALVIKSFSDARRRALQTQGVVTMERVRANQATMKSVP